MSNALNTYVTLGMVVVCTTPCHLEKAPYPYCSLDGHLPVQEGVLPAHGCEKIEAETACEDVASSLVSHQLVEGLGREERLDLSVEAGVVNRME